jgi:hypothetical protein
MTARLIVKPELRPPFRVEAPRGRPRKQKMRQAKGRANFLWTSTR